ncbi:phage antirepressor KilAC domain-containing protein [Heliobacterium chlorum]|uniref:Phage antirepressor KilAC domain-containing protein n=1 Tax=Heliobacterium chlorum TaxID=2698 RepID=A0ABR7T8P7_HELCL|nr:phage antirepressor KilAC domain-containing protein [Heliobacterium chlorum]MBC9786443.1 phage antirepressor KilAC domain-containing protein [Heliobacterium chlorum]
MKSLQVIEMNGQRVLMTAQLAEAYGTDNKHISDNYKYNQERYTEGKHFYCLQGDELKSFKIGYPEISDTLKYTSILYLWTEKGAWLHAKSLNTDQAWEAYEMLVDEYYRLKEQRQQSEPQYELPSNFAEALRQLADSVEENHRLRETIQEQAPKVNAYQTFMSAVNVLPVNEVAKSMELGPNTLFSLMRDWKLMFKSQDGYNIPYQHFIKAGCFTVKTKTFWKNGVSLNSSRTFVTPKGQDLIFRLARKYGLVKGG